MHSRVLVFLLLSVPFLAGCGAIHKPRKAALVDFQPQSGSKGRIPNKTPKSAEVTNTADAGEKELPVVKAVEPVPEGDGWLSKTRRQMAEVAKGIRADLDFHETEGLEAFSPNASDQVKALREEMDRAGDIRQ